MGDTMYIGGAGPEDENRDKASAFGIAFGWFISGMIVGLIVAIIIVENV